MYAAVADGMQEVNFLQHLWSLIYQDSDVVCKLVREDNFAGAIHLASNPFTIPNSKHMGIRHHFIRELVARGGFIVVHVR